MPTIRIGTRSSALALWQAYFIAGLLKADGLPSEIVPMETKGDKIQDKSLAKLGSKGVFTAELEVALHTGHVDIAVHSAKDLQSELPANLEIIAFTERETVNDVLVSFNHEVSLTNGRDWLIGTSSTRRVATLRHFHPHIRTTDMRGNLQTRLQKLHDGQCDGIILAYAGVHRMNYDTMIAAQLPVSQFTPAVGQGSIAVEAAATLDAGKKQRIRQLCNHVPTETCLLAERAYLNRLQGGCSIPVFALATITGATLTIQGGIISLDGAALIRQELSGTAAEATALGQQLATEVLQAGGERVLQQIRQQVGKVS